MSGNKPAPLPLTPRDIDILYALWSNRYMTAPQIEARFWQATAGGGLGTRKACQRRLRLLYERKLVRRIDQLVHYGQGHKPYLYTLDKLGAQLLIEKKTLTPRRSRCSQRVRMKITLFSSTFWPPPICALRSCAPVHTPVYRWSAGSPSGKLKAAA